MLQSQNSVPRFETAWLKRARFPYTAKSSAKIIRHAVAIDERRAKFRQNLISQRKLDKPSRSHHGTDEEEAQLGNGHDEKHRGLEAPQRVGTSEYARFKPRKSIVPTSKTISRRASASSINSTTDAQPRLFEDTVPDEGEDDEVSEQNIQEIWFPGCHADIGGGWPQEPGMEAGLSHAPLLWMIREARKVGMPFDEDALREAGYVFDDAEPQQSVPQGFRGPVPQIRVQTEREAAGNRSADYDLLHVASTKGLIHDSLEFGCGTPPGGVFAWRAMEYLPFRRMDLKSDGTWAPIRWPLPCGEVRDIPDEAWIHQTALKRMDADSRYRPGNLIVGGGGRGMRRAPEHMGTGQWKVLREKRDPVGEVFVRATKGGQDGNNPK